MPVGGKLVLKGGLQVTAAGVAKKSKKKKHKEPAAAAAAAAEPDAAEGGEKAEKREPIDLGCLPCCWGLRLCCSPADAQLSTPPAFLFF
jgi:hypothetical protein